MTSFLLALFACGRGDNPGGAGANAADADGDGFEQPDDCDDGNADVHPDAEEHCDGIDTNCDGELDGALAIEATPWYADADADGYGNPDLVQVACEAPNEFFIANGDDCDDAREFAYPGAQEYCDGIDDDCDGSTDEEDALDQGIVYVDADGDGAGDPDATSSECGVPEGFAAEPNDCDDTNPAMSPLLVEICNDGIDDDCDGSSAPCGFEGDKNLMLAEATLLGPEGDHLGLGMAAGDVDGDGTFDVAVQGGPTDAYGGGASGDIYLVGGPLSGLSDAADVAFATIDVEVSNNTYSPSGEALEILDLNGDGYDDVLAGNSGGNNGKGIYAFLSPLSGTYEPDDADYAITGTGVGGSFERIGDIDGDGFVDFGVGSAQQGVVYVVFGPIDGDVSTASLPVTVEGPCSTGGGGGCAAFGTGIGMGGDLDGDGEVDLVVGAPSFVDESSYSDEGAAYVYAGPFESVVGGDDYVSRIVGSAVYRSFGTALDIVPDLDGDGYDDLVFGNGADASYYAPVDPGQAGVFYGPITDIELTTADADFLFEGEGGDSSGVSVTVADTNADGMHDLVVGDSAEDGDVSHAGAVFVFDGPVGTGTAGTGDITGRAIGIGADHAGSVVANLGDVNGDGVEDIGIGGPEYQTTRAGQGAVFLVFGGGM